MPIVRNYCIYCVFGFNSRAFLRHIGLFRETPVGALTVCVWLYLVLKSANTGIIGAYGHGYWLLVNIDLGLFTCYGSSVAQHSNAYIGVWSRYLRPCM